MPDFGFGIQNDVPQQSGQPTKIDLQKLLKVMQTSYAGAQLIESFLPTNPMAGQNLSGMVFDKLARGAAHHLAQGEVVPGLTKQQNEEQWYQMLNLATLGDPAMAVGAHMPPVDMSALTKNLPEAAMALPFFKPNAYLNRPHEIEYQTPDVTTNTKTLANRETLNNPEQGIAKWIAINNPEGAAPHVHFFDPGTLHTSEMSLLGQHPYPEYLGPGNPTYRDWAGGYVVPKGTGYEFPVAWKPGKPTYTDSGKSSYEGGEWFKEQLLQDMWKKYSEPFLTKNTASYEDWMKSMNYEIQQREHETSAWSDISP